MPLSSTADRIVFTFAAKVGGPTMVSTLHIDHNDYDPETAVAYIDTQWKLRMKSMLSSGYWLGATYLYVQGDGGSTPYVYGVNTAGTGAAGNALAPQVSWLVQKRTRTPGRFARGRMYVPGISEDLVDDIGKLTGSVADQCATQMNLFRDDLLGYPSGELVPVVHSGNAAGRPQANYAIEQFTVDPFCATQRRRLKR